MLNSIKNNSGNFVNIYAISEFRQGKINRDS